MKEGKKGSIAIQWNKAVSIVFMLVVGLLCINVVPAKADENTIYDASVIDAKGSYSGWLDGNSDYYKLILNESGKVTVTISMNTSWGNFYFYDNEYNRLDWHSINYDNNRACLYRKQNLYFSAGTYYFKFEGGEGSYSFVTDFQAAGETFPESQANQNNILDQARNISLDTKYVGQIGYGDSQDFYKFKVPFTGQISISHYNYIDGYQSSYEILDTEGNRIYTFSGRYDSNKGYACDVDTFSLKTGEYYLKATGEHGFYNFTIKAKPNPTQISKTSRNKTKATVKIEKLSGATGYVLQYSTSSKFSKSTTKTKTVNSTSVKLTGLKKTKTYYLRVRAYKSWNGKKYYSDYGNVVTMYP